MAGLAGTNTIPDTLSGWLLGALVTPHVWWPKTLPTKRKVNLGLEPERGPVAVYLTVLPPVSIATLSTRL